MDFPLFVEQKEVENKGELQPLEEELSQHDIDEEYFDAPDEEGATSNEYRRSKRENKGVNPRHLDDYIVGIAACAVHEPLNYKEAMKSKEWCDAMEEELNSHHRKGTWDLVPLPKDRKVVGSKWVFKVKRNEENKVTKFKARVVAQGFTQQFGVDFDEVYAPVTRQASLRIFLTVVASQNLVVRHLDVKTAYLNGVLEEEIFMRQPPGTVARGQEELVCRLKRSIYGLRQSARCWNAKLKSVLVMLGFKSSAAEQCLYVKTVNGKKVFLLVYVDDILLAGHSEAEVKNIITDLSKEFELTDLGEVRHFLGLEVIHEEDCYLIRLKIYIEQLIVKNGMEDAKISKSPMDSGFLKVEEKGEKFEDTTKYRSLVGGLLYLAVIARPDIAVSTAILGRSFSVPCEADWSAAKRVLRYLKATKDLYLRLGGKGDEGLVGYSDADWAGDPASRRSTSGSVFYYRGGLISWSSRRQQCVTLSSMEAEYVALSEACQETVWLRQLLADFGETQSAPTVLKEDNQGCLSFVKTERTSRRSKHISTKEKFIQELCDKGDIVLEYCPTDIMIADAMTKPHGRFTKMLGLQKIQ